VTLFRRTPRRARDYGRGRGDCHQGRGPCWAPWQISSASARQQGGRISGAAADRHGCRPGVHSSGPSAGPVAHQLSRDRDRAGAWRQWRCDRAVKAAARFDAGYHLTVCLEAGAEAGQEGAAYRAPGGCNVPHHRACGLGCFGRNGRLERLGRAALDRHARGVGCIRGCWRGYWRRRAARRTSVAMVDQEASMLEMVRAGVGLSLCREVDCLAPAADRGTSDVFGHQRACVAELFNAGTAGG